MKPNDIVCRNACVCVSKLLQKSDTNLATCHLASAYTVPVLIAAEVVRIQRELYGIFDHVSNQFVSKSTRILRPAISVPFSLIASSTASVVE